jgi:hypothetical protein
MYGRCVRNHLPVRGVGWYGQSVFYKFDANETVIIGKENFADFWSYSIANNQWTLISENTSTVGGPSARSCHNMVFNPSNGNISVLGQHKDPPRQGVNPQSQRSDSDFFKYSTRAAGGGKWTAPNPAGVVSHGVLPFLSVG